MREKVPFALLCVAILAFACGPRQRNESATSRSSDRPTVTAPADAPLTPSLDIKVGDGVRFAFNVTNDGAKKIEVLFPDGRTHEVLVLDSLGREVWRWSEGRLFTQAVQNRVLRSSDSLRFEESWANARPGSYTVIATLASVNFPVEQRAEFVVR
ncbi:MAG: BsuPI-related putative proteinase inhibitor [Gemmatimonadaceae bacterium]